MVKKHFGKYYTIINVFKIERHNVSYYKLSQLEHDRVILEDNLEDVLTPLENLITFSLHESFR